MPIYSNVLDLYELYNNINLIGGAFEPRKLKREKVKEVLLSFRRSLQNVGSECTKSSVTTFDYV